MITRDQAEQAADSLLDQSKKELSAKQDKRAKLASAERRRRESPLLPAFVAAITTYGSLNYLDNASVSVMLGAAIGGLFGWAARRS